MQQTNSLSCGCHACHRKQAAALLGPGRGNRVLVGFEGWLPAACWEAPSGGQASSGVSLKQGRQAVLDGCKAWPLLVVVLQAGVDKLLQQWAGRSRGRWFRILS